MHSASHAAVHPPSHAAVPATTAAVPATAAASERRWRKSKRRTKRNRDEATQELVVHPNFLRGRIAATDTVARRRRTRRPKRSNDFK
jgi:hypothetical protein